MNKPLSKEERARLPEFLGDGTDDRCFLNQQWAQKLLADANFWREAVKNQDALELFDSRTTPPEYRCAFCEEVGTQDTPFHKPDCPWLLANES